MRTRGSAVGTLCNGPWNEEEMVTQCAQEMDTHEVRGQPTPIFLLTGAIRGLARGLPRGLARGLPRGLTLLRGPEVGLSPELALGIGIARFFIFALLKTAWSFPIEVSLSRTTVGVLGVLGVLGVGRLPSSQLPLSLSSWLPIYACVWGRGEGERGVTIVSVRCHSCINLHSYSSSPPLPPHTHTYLSPGSPGK